MTSLYEGSFINSVIFGSSVSRSRTNKQSLRRLHLSSLRATAEPTAPVPPVSKTLFPCNLRLKSSDGKYFSVASSTYGMAGTGYLVEPPAVALSTAKKF